MVIPRWPVTLDGFLSPARGNINQYEFWSRDAVAIAASLPLIAGNPYVETVGTGRGIEVTCRFGNHTVDGQFHRKLDDQGIWLYNTRRIRDSGATDRWNAFILHFGIVVGTTNVRIPVYMEFYAPVPLMVRIRLHGGGSGPESKRP